MAERRMFAKSVINSGRFLQMPPTSRLLYYDLGMAADDDGIVEAFTVIRTTGATEDDLKVLSAKGFIKVLNQELVSFITDWKRNNYTRPDRYVASAYNELLVKIDVVDQAETNGKPLVDQWETQDRLGKESIGKVNTPLYPPLGGGRQTSNGFGMSTRRKLARKPLGKLFSESRNRWKHS